MSDLSEMTAEVVKQGETCIITTLRRSVMGLQVSVKAHAAVELFMRGLSDEGAAPVEVRVSDRYWEPISQKAPPLLAYRITKPLPSLSGQQLFSIDLLAKPLLDLEERVVSSNVVNLSYLRLVGISEGAGVAFNLRGVYSLDALRRLQERVTLAQQQFYIQYIRPVKLSVIVSTQELQL